MTADQQTRPPGTADHEGEAVAAGTRVLFRVHGVGRPTLLLLPTWTIVHQRFWKLQVPYLARHHRVVTFDGPGNGLSDRPVDPAAYDHDRQVERALAVLDATGTEQAVVVAVSRAAYWALDLAANHAERVLGTALIAPFVRLGQASGQVSGQAPGQVSGQAPGRERAKRPDPADLPASAVPHLGIDPPEHWVKHDPRYWQRSYDDFLWFFFGQCFPEPHSTRPIEEAVGWGRETTAEVLAAEAAGALPSGETVREWCGRISSPLLAVHGDDDRVSPVERSRLLVELTGGHLVEVAGGGHLSLAREPVKVNHLLRDFARTAGAAR
ncbi:Pimeloyl-ACP methyl ester carboxylesterase [Nocardioides terrae]|uniref:Pimeloyl-ACP methyl ester carboxylesterase n=1 Tax=Nocardioides terrae TaxID=574651 RepID=A0A1I1DS59_9ACTN|nr:alpha/beta hydrolase [Nocardioides terrae]SFB75878.1 Pimeloyl-ACP methyl ester carboxylesterase [Nocardioides terrae]